jgi:hypothetical protein
MERLISQGVFTMAHLFGKQWTRDALIRRIGSVDQIAGIRLMENGDGTERGGRVLHVWTGTGLYFHVLADRGLDLSACRLNGRSLSWLSSTGETHPAYYEPEGLRWLRSFAGGLLATCGLDHFGPPNVDQGEEFGQHGRYGNIPAKAVSYSAAWNGDEYELSISGEVRQTRVFGENIVLRRRIWTRMGSSQINIEDHVTNEGFSPQPHMILYHFNLGFPLLSESLRLVLEPKETIARDAEGEKGIREWRNFTPPQHGFNEQVFRHIPPANADGQAEVKLENPEHGVALTLKFDLATLPYLYQWKMMGEGLYVLGIEPSNSSTLLGRASARAQGVLPHLEPGETRVYRLSLDIAALA